MGVATGESGSRRSAVARQRRALDGILTRYGVVNPRLLGSVARGDATTGSDVDLLVDLLPDGGNETLRVAGISVEFSLLLGARVDVVADSLLRDGVSEAAMAEAVLV